MKMFKLFTNKTSFIMTLFLQNTFNNEKSELGFFYVLHWKHEDARSKILHKLLYEKTITQLF